MVAVFDRNIDDEADGRRQSKRSLPAAHREAIEWITDHPSVLDDYQAGTWLALDGARVVGYGDSSFEAVESARREDVADPLIYPVIALDAGRDR